MRRALVPTVAAMVQIQQLTTPALGAPPLLSQEGSYRSIFIS
jgi:hypothetical protein